MALHTRRMLFVLAVGISFPAHSETFRMRGGRILHGEIVAADEQGLQVKRWDNGGAVTLPWAALLSDESHRLRRASLRESSAARPTVPGVRIITVQGAVVEGIVVEDTPERVVLKLGLRRPQIPARSIRRRVAIDLDQEAVYTSEELYDQQAKAVDLATADGNLLLAEYALAIRLPGKAREHYVKAAEIDPSRKDHIAQLLEGFDKRQREAEARKLRADLLALAAAGKFETVHDLLAKLRDAYAETDAGHDADALAQRLQADEEQYKKNRDEFLRKKIVPAWFEGMEMLLRKKGGDRKATLADARAYADGNLEPEIKARLASQFNVQDADIDRYWSEREGAQTHRAGYGSGSWIVAGGASGAAGSGGAEGGASALDRLLGKKAGRPDGAAAARGAQNKPKAFKLDTAEEWWSDASSLTRAEWLEAYFAEKALKVVERKTRVCQQCGGEGTFLRITSGTGGGSTEELPCRRCHGAQNEITIVYQ